MAGTGASIVIEELDPSGRNPTGRSLVLQGSTLPYAGASWSTDQTLTTDWYPGNSTDATQQLLGVKELPSSWSGAWHRTMMGTSPAIFTDVGDSIGTKIVSPHILYETIRTYFVLPGPLLRVSFNASGEVFNGVHSVDDAGNPVGTGQELSYSLVRVGRLKTITPSFQKITDIDWSMVFEWAGTGPVTSRVATVREEANVVSAALEYSENLANAIAQIQSQVPKRPYLSKTIGMLNQLAAAPGKLVDQFTSELSTAAFEFQKVASVAERFAQLPQSFSGAVQNMARSVQRNSKNTARQLERIPVELLVNTVFLPELVQAQVTYAEYGDITSSQIRKSYELDQLVFRQQFASSNTGQIPNNNNRGSGVGVLAVHICKEGDTPNSLAIHYFQDADRGDEICKANRLPWQTPKFQKGQILLIPAIPNQRVD